ncbi:hypothetical protein HYH03_011934 [Edaphochlamys debaryana]|uniref:Glycosyltransferase n=1 Tax=Edaphochlamys debaryana TaxID=47281 RepID=A0A836BUK1_9CHLO|nr:hypothetical protein HYH03_011934 [Edaphochlamys debaryana]|eukprot:KAG2489656.1 hypothetical protein HYH03_011934 [Edaphochlamys debaryana]
MRRTISAALACLIVALHSAGAASRYVIYNDIFSHWHVFAGVVATVREHIDPRPDLLWMSERDPASISTSRHKEPPFGLQEWLGDTPGAPALQDWTHVEFPRSPEQAEEEADITGAMRAALTWGPVDVLICVSPELDPYKSCAYAAKYLKAKRVIALIHRGTFVTTHSWFLQMEGAGGGQVPVHLLALVPHVVTSANHTLKGSRPIHWATMVAPYRSPQPCEAKACMEGFVVQGSMRYRSGNPRDGFIRDYDSLFKQMQADRGSGAVTVKILGRGNAHDLNLPPALEPRVAYYGGIPFPEYWELIDKSYALVPFHGTPQYYTVRCSSTVLASLTTCVPLIANDELLAAYHMFRKEHVYYQAPGESEMDVMKRVMALPERELLAKRAAVCRLRDEQLRRGAGVIKELARGAVDAGAAAAERAARTSDTKA